MAEEIYTHHLEHYVRELQTAVATVVRHLGIEHEVAAAERKRLDEVRAKGEAPLETLIELYSTPPR